MEIDQIIPALRNGFGSDNHAGVHPEILQAVIAANVGHAHSYGDDPFTERAEALIRRHFGNEAVSYFVFNGTGANVTALAAITSPYDAVICAETSHLNIDECGAPERLGGLKLLTLPTVNGKIYPDQILSFFPSRRGEHQVRPRVISITQSTEMGTVYTQQELSALSEVAHENNLYLHVDGARFSNAAVCLDADFKSISKDVGVDVISFGGTKNGLLFGEAVIFLSSEAAPDYKFYRKQNMQLASKMRFISAQFCALLEGNLWQRNAEHANSMAKVLANRIKSIPGIRITQKTEANAVFVRVPVQVISELKEACFFYDWNIDLGEIRLMTSFDTTLEDIDLFGDVLEQKLKILNE